MTMMMPATAQAQQHIQFATARTAKVIVTVGKSEDIHTDQNFVDIMVATAGTAGVGHTFHRCSRLWVFES